MVLRLQLTPDHASTAGGCNYLSHVQSSDCERNLHVMSRALALTSVVALVPAVHWDVGNGVGERAELIGDTTTCSPMYLTRLNPCSRENVELVIVFSRAHSSIACARQSREFCNRVGMVWVARAGGVLVVCVGIF